MLDKMDFRPMADHLDMFQHVCREWNQEADRLTHVAREKKGPLGTLFAMGREATIEAVRSFFNGGVSAECGAQIQSKVGVSLRGSNCLKWKTFVEVARILLNDATVTQPECTTAVEAARAICCLARTGSICFDLDVKLIEDHNGNKTRQRNGMKEDTEGRWKRPEITSRFSNSSSTSRNFDILPDSDRKTSHHADFCDTCSSKMDQSLTAHMEYMTK